MQARTDRQTPPVLQPVIWIFSLAVNPATGWTNETNLVWRKGAEGRKEAES